MHNILPYERWLSLYDPALDERSPFHGKEYNYDVYSENIYGYYIDPAWDFMGSETLYIKILFASYKKGFAIVEFIGEWNDAINNDIMHLKRNVIELLAAEGINKYILIGENILNFHGSDDSYYEEWFDDVEEGWIAAVSFPEFIRQEMERYGIDRYINMGGTLEIERWRTLQPNLFFELVDKLIQRRLN
ncbi:hypothetical protein SanaruYs_10570 [Chryseotalea sanaruensis]|uniref:Uncharacterized protein n=1 Tax=Chryseotalea sanaruensis TaxID=2482724 RepID=A0A401U7H4_9BACT|nr:hypothetical protein [Chryseotalea sanaruensis]GCC50838.1 hypothetical protein SanaruYs_10570 [Chryseotalea sanaruensis]